MRRRKAIALIGAVATLPLAARAQRAEHLRQIAVMLPMRDSNREYRSYVEAFRQRLRELGWTEANLRIEYRWYGGDLDRRLKYAAELVSLKPDVIFCLSTPAVRAFKRVTRSVPIVFVNANNPVSCDQLPGSEIFHAFCVKSKALWSWPSARQSRRP